MGLGCTTAEVDVDKLLIRISIFDAIGYSICHFFTGHC